MNNHVFKAYSKYYDLLYADKDYETESEYIMKKIEKYNAAALSLLDFGCGTGEHCGCFKNKFSEVCGIDFSQDMVDIAKKKHSLDFVCGDIARVNLKRTFDVVVSLFHVMSYQNTDESLLLTMRNSYEHLNHNGLFLFDCWYGPGVITTKPETRIKRLNDNNIEIIRIAEPTLYPNKNCVDVNYTIIIKNKFDDSVEFIKETHNMRYLFAPEVEFLLKMAGFELLECQEFMSDKIPDYNTWNTLFIAKKI